MKTLFLFEEIPEDSFFFEVEGDYSDLNEVYVNSSDDEEKVMSLNRVVYDSEGDYKVKALDKPTRDWDVFVKCGIFL